MLASRSPETSDLDEVIDARAAGGEKDDRLTPLERLLFDCLRARADGATVERLKTLSEQELTSLIDLADEQIAGPTLWHRLLSPACMPALPDHTRQTTVARQRRTAMANMRIHCDFRRVVLALHECSIPVVALKGLHLLSLVYGHLARRATGDIDLLVPAKDLASAGAAVHALGYQPLSPYRISHDSMPYAWHHLPRFVKSGASDVEIHWHIVDPSWVDTTLSPDINELWDRSVSARVAGVDVQVLAPEDLLLHLCIHATYGHLCEFAARPWCDIAQTITRYSGSLSWQEVTSRATRWRCRRGTYLALRLARDLVGAAVPDDVLESLRPANLDEHVLTRAIRRRHRVRLPLPIARLSGQRGSVGKLRSSWKRVLLPRDVLADIYNVPRSSRFIYVFYPIRLVHLVRHHWQTVFRLHHRDPALTTLAADLVALSEFLAEE